MIRCAMMMAEFTRWETSGRRSTWVPPVPAHATEDSRYDTQAPDQRFSVCHIQNDHESIYSRLYEGCLNVHLCTSQQGWRCENCRRPGADVGSSLLQPVRYGDDKLRKTVSRINGFLTFIKINSSIMENLCLPIIFNIRLIQHFLSI